MISRELLRVTCFIRPRSSRNSARNGARKPTSTVVVSIAGKREKGEESRAVFSNYFAWSTGEKSRREKILGARKTRSTDPDFPFLQIDAPTGNGNRLIFSSTPARVPIFSHRGLSKRS